MTFGLRSNLHKFPFKRRRLEMEICVSYVAVVGLGTTTPYYIRTYRIVRIPFGIVDYVVERD